MSFRTGQERMLSYASTVCRLKLNPLNPNYALKGKSSLILRMTCMFISGFTSLAERISGRRKALRMRKKTRHPACTAIPACRKSAAHGPKVKQLLSPSLRYQNALPDSLKFGNISQSHPNYTQFHKVEIMKASIYMWGYLTLGLVCSALPVSRPDGIQQLSPSDELDVDDRQASFQEQRQRTGTIRLSIRGLVLTRKTNVPR